MSTEEDKPILLLDTATDVLSVALSRGGVATHHKVCEARRSHAALAACLVRDLLEEAGCTLRDCAGVCVDCGPGSYTGLRVGVSLAKGICFGAGIPLLAMESLETLVAGVADADQFACIVPMLDARRMEVYTAAFRTDGSPDGMERIRPTHAQVVEKGTFDELLCPASPTQPAGQTLFVGDGALKCQEVIGSPQAVFRAAYPLARHMAATAWRKLRAGQTEDVAYFEPFYLKAFKALPPRPILP